MTQFRKEKDSLGLVEVPADALYAAQTQRAIENFSIGDVRMPEALIKALAEIKSAAAKTNANLGEIGLDTSVSIQNAAAQIVAGGHSKEFPVSVYQTGSGTSTNMNMNEVLASLASESLGRAVHPNDEINLGQSSNDVIPSAIQVAVAKAVQENVIPALTELANRIERIAIANSAVVKTGRTHLMDAVPLTLEQEFGTWAFQLREHMQRFDGAIERLCQLPIGGTAVGTGLNTHPEFAAQVCELLSTKNLSFSPSENKFSRIAGQEVGHEISALFEGVAVTLIKVCNDLRWMNSGPNNGLAEIQLPELQPGSSIMPGKVNPVIPEAVLMAMTQVMGYHSSISIAAQSGNFQLNVMLPLIGHNLLSSADLVASSARHLEEKVFSKLKINRQRIESQLSQNPILVTALNPVIGYEKAAEIAKIAMKEGRSIIDVAEENTEIDRAELERLLSAKSMT